MKYYIKERYNPQTGTYFVAEGQMTKTEAKRHEKPIYGWNIMHGFDSLAAYEKRLGELKSEGRRVANL